MNVKSRKAEKSEITRRALIGAARDLFAERGYACVSTEEIVQRAGVTRGALYHHFLGKEELFKATYLDLEREIAARVAAEAFSRPDPWEQLRAGCQAFLNVCREPAVQRIVLIDAPSVLGWDAWREVDAEYGLGLMSRGLRAAKNAGLIDPQPVEPLAQLLLGALNAAAMLIARAPDVDSARAEVGATLDRLLDGLRSRKRG